MAAKAAKAVRRAARKPRAAKRATRKAARKARRVARKARRAAKPKAPKAARKPRAPKATKKRLAKKVKKAKRVTRKMQTGSYAQVWHGSKKFTKGGLTKDQLMKNKRGKIVSKKRNGTKIGAWMTAVKKARKELGITGFVLMNRGAQGTALYKRAKELMA